MQELHDRPRQTSAALARSAEARVRHEDLRRARPERGADRADAASPARRSCCSRTAPTSAASTTAATVLQRAARTRTSASSRSGSSRTPFDAQALQKLAARRATAPSSQASEPGAADADLRRRSAGSSRERVPAQLPVAPEPEHARQGRVTVAGRSRGGDRRVHDAGAAHRPARPYNPSTFDRVIQSPWTMLVVALAVRGADRLRGQPARRAARSRSSTASATSSRCSSNERRSRENERSSASRPGSCSRGCSRSARGARWSERLGTTLELADIEAEPIQVVVLTAIGTLLAMIILGSRSGVFGVIAP